MYLNFGGFMAECVLDETKTINDWKANEGMWFAVAVNGKRNKFSDEQMTALWDSILIERRRIKDIAALNSPELTEEAKRVNIEFDISDEDLESLNFD